jgi:hypothetical protein
VVGHRRGELVRVPDVVGVEKRDPVSPREIEARLRATDSPWFCCRTTRTEGPNAAATAAEPSVEPSSITRISAAGRVCASAEASAAER